MLISILEPDAMYIVKNTGTMVIGVSKDLGETLKEEQPLKRLTSPPRLTEK